MTTGGQRLKGGGVQAGRIDGPDLSAVSVNPAAGTATFTVASSSAKTPIATTGRARSVKTTSATLAGSVNPEGGTTTYRFEFGRSARYCHATPARSAGSGTSTRSLSARIAGLRPNTVYHYRIVARSAGGRGVGRDWPSGPRAPVSITHLRASPADRGSGRAYPKNVRASSR